MKVKYLIVLLTGFVSISFANSEEPLSEKVEKYTVRPENSFVLPTDFAGHLIIDQSELIQLKNKKIYHIDLVYTHYKSSPDFDQVKLNQDRIVQLKNIVPQVATDAPGWSYVEQTGALTSAQAKTYFHGFVIHYSDGIDYSDLNTFFEEFQKPYMEYEIDNSIGAVFRYCSGTILKIESNSVLDSNGKPVSGNYELSYREFRNPAEIALSGIPMTYSENGENYNFSSVGMYEIHATQNGETLNLSKPIVVDFNCTKVDQDVSFYQMNNEGKWSQIMPVNFDEQNEELITKNESIVVLDQVVKEPAIFFETGCGKISTQHFNGDFWLSKLNDASWNNYTLIKKLNPTIFDTIVISEIPDKYSLRIKPHASDDLSDILFFPEQYFPNMKFVIVKEPHKNALQGEVDWIGERAPIPNDKQSTLLVGSGDAGHTYPSVVRGLNSPEFGVYNCDQIYRIGNSVALAPTYVDEKTGKEINNKHVACVMDLTYNGSFSFQPNYLTCNADGRNVILLFTSDKKIYMLSEDGFASLDKTDRDVTMPMQDITAQIKSSEDLKQLLNI